MGAQCHEEPEGLVIKQSTLQWAQCECAADHRIALALACAGLAANGVTIQRAECINKTFANFVPAMQKLGANLEWCDARDSVRT